MKNAKQTKSYENSEKFIGYEKKDTLFCKT